MMGQCIAGGGLVALAVLCAALRFPPSRPVAREPGRWLPVRPEDAVRPDNGGSSRWWALAAIAGVGLIAFVAWRVDPQASRWAVLDFTPILPLFLTGCSSQRPVVGPAQSARLLSRAFSSLKGGRILRVVPWARVGLNGAIDELRLLVTPCIAVPGVVAIELGHTWCRTPVGWAPAPEVLVRTVAGSSAAAKLVQIAPGRRLDLGRRVQERVARIAPPAPTREACVALVRRLANHLTDRRLPSSGPQNGMGWQGSERRVAC
jgi:hypothetical protein